MRLYTRALNGSIDWANDTIKVLLLKTTDSDPTNEYQFNPDHDFINDILGGDGSEVTVAGYARQTIANATPTIDDTNNWVSFDCDDIEFEITASGENIYGIVFYKEVNDDDDSVLIAFDNGYIPVTAAADAVLNDTEMWVEKLLDNLPSGATVDFGGGATGTLDAAASKDDRSISIGGSGIAAGVTAGDKSAMVRTSRVKTQATPPALLYLNGGTVTLAIDANGVFVAQGAGNAV